MFGGPLDHYVFGTKIWLFHINNKIDNIFYKLIRSRRSLQILKSTNRFIDLVSILHKITVSIMSSGSSKTAWLSSKLKQFALDEEIYLNYIESVLDGEEERSEKISALEAILGDILSENDVRTQCMEIINMYDKKEDNDIDKVKKIVEDPEETLVKMLENNIRTVAPVPSKEQNLNDEDSDLVKIRKNILTHYAQKEANSEEEECDDLDIEHNTNASSVLALKKEQRERAKEQSQRKKEKDKEDREKQKQLAQEKKDAKKKKAQKVERKR